MFSSDFIFFLLVVQGVGGQSVMGAAPPSIMCSNTYPVSHDWEWPHHNIYRIDGKDDDIPTLKTCQAWCNEDVRCRSVMYVIIGDWRRCDKYSISLQELKDSGRYNEIMSVGIASVITYDKQCVVNFTSMCSNTYPVSHDREEPDWGIYGIAWKRVDNATFKTCQDWCNEDVTCRSVVYVIHGDGSRWCDKYRIRVQELKDLGNYSLIYTNADTGTYITYDRDRDCEECPPGLEPYSLIVGFCTPCSPGFFKPSRGSENCTICVDGEVSKDKTSCAECTYPVSHAWEYPAWDYFIDGKGDDVPTLKTCQAWCNEDVRCKSVKYMISGDGRWCDKFSISVQELKDSGRYNEIYHIGIFSYITYDKQCADPPSITCSNTYPMSHEGESPDRNIYLIEEKRDDNFTLKTCQDWCNKDVRCRSVGYGINVDDRWCYKYSISIQELKDSGRYNEIINWGINSIITYDKQCVVNYTSTTCSNTYPVSHDRERPSVNYHIAWKQDDNVTLKTCQDWCNEDVRCRSVMYEILRDGRRWCDKFSIRVQELKDLGKYSLIYTETDTGTWPTYITYDRDCECPPGLEASSLLVDFCKTCLSGFFKPSRGSEKCTKCVDGEVSKDKTSCVEVSPTTKGPGTDGDEVSPGTNVAAIGEPMIVLILMIGAGAVFVAPMLPGAEVAF